MIQEKAYRFLRRSLPCAYVVSQTIGSPVELFIGQLTFLGTDGQPIGIPAHHVLESLGDGFVDILSGKLDECAARVKTLRPYGFLLRR
jgi:hypothetical protein